MMNKADIYIISALKVWFLKPIVFTRMIVIGYLINNCTFQNAEG